MDGGKFSNLNFTASGAVRAGVQFYQMKTLWFNTGTLCNIACESCYIESSPSNNRLAYLTITDVNIYLDQLAYIKNSSIEIGFTGGEPFMNPDIIDQLREALGRGHRVLVLTNAMRPMLRHKGHLLSLLKQYGNMLRIRVSIDHYTKELHDAERGDGSWNTMVQGCAWLANEGFSLSVGGRNKSGENEDQLRAGYHEFFESFNLGLNANESQDLLIFPEMDAGEETPEITENCWEELGVNANQIMCATSRMVVKRRGAIKPVVISCTLLPYDKQFELSESLSDAIGVTVKLNHPHCAKFCVLGGGGCGSS